VAVNNSHSFFNKLKTNEIYNDFARPVIIADNLRTPENMGSVLRLAGNIGAEKVLFINDNKDNIVRNWKIKKTASGAEKKVNWKIISQNELLENIPKGYKIVAIETSENSQNIFETELPGKIAFIVGNEVFGINDDLLKLAEIPVFIPVPGQISSLNVTHALSIALFEWLRRLKN